MPRKYSVNLPSIRATGRITRRRAHRMDLYGLCRAYDQLKLLEVYIEQSKSAIKKELVGRTRKSIFYAGNFRAQLERNFTNSYIDREALRRDHPKIYRKYLKPTREFTRLTITRVYR